MLQSCTLFWSQLPVRTVNPSLQQPHPAVNLSSLQTKRLTSGSGTAAAPWTSAVPQLENWQSPGSSSENNEECFPSTSGIPFKFLFSHQLHRVSFEKNKLRTQLAPNVLLTERMLKY